VAHARRQHAQVDHERQLEDGRDRVSDPNLLLTAAQLVEQQQRQVHHAHRGTSKVQREGQKVRDERGVPESQAQGQRLRRLLGKLTRRHVGHEKKDD
jgi:hypothetical protein